MENVAPASDRRTEGRHALMIAHLFKLVWNRRRSNTLVVVEIFFCFLVVYAVLTAGAYLAEQYRYPLGFSYDNVWWVSVEYNDSPSFVQLQEQTARLLQAVQSMDEVERAGMAAISPYSGSSFIYSFEVQGHSFLSMKNSADATLDDVLGITVVRGRWFEEGDETHHWTPMIINEHLAREVYGNENPVGKVFPQVGGSERERRVVGVIRDFRQNGELSAPGNYFFDYAVSRDTNVVSPQSIVFKVRPGTNAAFEEHVVKRLQTEVPSVKFRVESLADMRSFAMQIKLVPLIIAGVVAGFLLLMAGLGLVGVLWQNVARRTREIGLRRAVGARATDVYRQILGELFVLVSFGLLAGTLLVLQVPLLGLIGGVSTGVYLTGLAAALCVMYILAFVCGVYPGILATRVQPTEALHYE